MNSLFSPTLENVQCSQLKQVFKFDPILDLKTVYIWDPVQLHQNSFACWPHYHFMFPYKKSIHHLPDFMNFVDQKLCSSWLLLDYLFCAAQRFDLILNINTFLLDGWKLISSFVLSYREFWMGFTFMYSMRNCAVRMTHI